MSEPSQLEERGVAGALLVRDRRWLAIYLTPIAVVFGVLVLAVDARRIDGVTAVLGGAIVLFLVSAIGGLGQRRERMPGRVDVAGDVLRWNGRRWLARGDLRQVDWRADPALGPVVHFRLKLGMDARLLVATPADARRLVDALGYGPRARTASFTVMSPAFDLPAGPRLLVTLASMLVPVGLLLSAIAERSSGALFLGLATMALVVPALAVWHGVRTRIEVGTDGIARRWLWRRGFVPHGDVVRVEPLDHEELDATYHAIAIDLRDGRCEKLVVTPKTGEPTERDRLLERIREAVSASGTSDDASVAAALARGPRDPRAWIHALRSRGAGADADHRTAPIESARLWRLVDDVQAVPVVRAAAAVALSVEATPRERERIRVAARATASPDLRAALEQAACTDTEADDDALSASLAALEPKRSRS